MMTSLKGLIYLAVLALLASVCHTAIGSDASDGDVSALAISVDANGDDTASIPDFDGDGTIGFGDFVIFAGVFGARQGDEKYEATHDLNGDGEIEFSDFVIFAQNFGKEVPPSVTLPPPTWVFAGDVPADHQTVLREEMEYVRAFFADRHGVEATGFTVLVGGDNEAVSSVYRGLVGADLGEPYDTQTTNDYAWVAPSATGSAVIMLGYGGIERNPLSALKHHIAHEYFHVLQGQLASGFAQLQNGEIAWHTDTSIRGPNWLMEGLASYADYAYTPSRMGRRPFLDDRYTPYRDLTWFHLNEGLSIGDLAGMEDYRTFACNFSHNYRYPLSFAASVFLLEQAEEDSYVNYWKLLGERPNWQQAFEEAFGIGVNDFYKAFDEWLPSQLLHLVQLKLQMHWPDMENQTWRFLYVDIDSRGTWEKRLQNYDTGSSGGLPFFLVVTYDDGAVATGYLSLWWSDDQCTEHLLGWYKDGELTSRREDATAVEFTGRSSTIDWNIPGNPDRLPRLEENKPLRCK